ncbi:unnamed protein product, partial [Closterium sp. NIES-53]
LALLFLTSLSSSQSHQQPSALPRQVTMDSGCVGARGAGTGGASFGGAGAGGSGTRGANSGDAGAGGAGAGGASSGDAGAGGTGARGASFGGAGAAGAARGAGAVGAGEVGVAAALGLPSSPPVHSQSPTVNGPTFPPPDSAPAVSSPPQSQSSPPVVPHDWTNRCPPCARPSSPISGLRTILFCSSPRCSPPVSVLPSPPESSLTVSSHPITDYYRVARPVVSCILASLVTDPRASPSSVSALTAAIAGFASTRRLDYATCVVAAPPPLSVGGESALGCDILEDRQFEVDFLAAASPSLCAMLLSLEGDPTALDIPTPRTYRYYVGTVPPPRANVVDDMWIFKLKRPPGSPPVFRARYVARAFGQREGVNFFQTFASTPKITTLRVLLHVAAQRDYEVHSLDFSTALRRQVYGLRQSPREWHDTLRSTLRDLGFRPSSADPSLFVRTGSTPFFMLVYVLRRFRFQFSTTQPTPLAIDHRLTGPFPDEPFESSGPYVELVDFLVHLMTCTRSDLAFPLSVLSCFVATGRHRPVRRTAAVRVAKYLATTSGMGLVLGGTQPVVLTAHSYSSYADDVETKRSTQGYYFSLGAGAVSWRSTRSSSVASSSAEAEI